MCETVVEESSDDDGLREEKGCGSSPEYNSEEDSDWTSSDVESECSNLDIEENLPFHCEECIKRQQLE